MEFVIHRSKGAMLFVVCTVMVTVALQVWNFSEKGDWALLLGGLGIWSIVNFPILEVFLKKHKIKNGTLKYGIWNRDVMLSDVKVVRQVGKWMPNLELTTNKYDVHFIAVPKDKEVFLSLLQEANPNVKLELSK